MGGKIHLGITEDLKQNLRKSKHVILFLDYDGTLVPIKKRPGLARIPGRTRKLLKALSKKKWAKVFIITGRTLRNIKGLVGLDSLSYVGNHGFELEDRDLKFYSKEAEDSKKAIAEIHKKLIKSLRGVNGVIIEDKYYTLSVHYRLVKKNNIDILKRKFYNIVNLYKRKKTVIVTEGKKVLEIRPNIKWNKGTMTEWLMKRIKFEKPFPIYIGDDRTDEDAFGVLKKRGLTILVSGKSIPTKAKYRLKSPEEVFRFLNNLIKLKENV